MRRKVFIRLSNKAKKMSISDRPLDKPLDNGLRYGRKVYPTIQFALNLEIPDDLFRDVLFEEDIEVNHAISLTDINIEEANNET